MFPALILFTAIFIAPANGPVPFTSYDLPETVAISACEIADLRDNRVKLRIQGTYTGTTAAEAHLNVVIKHRNHALGDLNVVVPLQPDQQSWQQVVWIKLSDHVQPFQVDINFQRLD